MIKKTCELLKSNFKIPVQYICLLCGSAIHEKDPRDIDFIVYVESEKLFQISKKIYDNWGNYAISIDAMDELNMYAVKLRYMGKPVTLHIVSYSDMERYVEYACKPETYIDVEILAYKLNYTTVYRKWILQTEYVCGNPTMRTDLISKLNNSYPEHSVCSILCWRIKNTINYCIEKWENDELARGILLLKVFREVLLYCYATNKAYYGTIKDIDIDLRNFNGKKDLCRKCTELFRMVNHDINSEQIQKLLYELEECID